MKTQESYEESDAGQPGDLLLAERTVHMRPRECEKRGKESCHEYQGPKSRRGPSHGDADRRYRLSSGDHIRAAGAGKSSDSSSEEQSKNPVSRGADYLLNYLNMAGATKASQFRPMKPAGTHPPLLQDHDQPSRIHQGRVLRRA